VFGAKGYYTSLVGDDAALQSFEGASDFQQCVDLLGDTNCETRAPDVSHTSLARLFAAACEVLASGTSQAPHLVWVHSRGMYGPWDAPLDLQQSLLDEGDPPPVDSVAPPEFSLAESDDPEAAFRYACAYAAQCMVFDSCWELLLDVVKVAGAGRQWIVILLGARGFPLGEHRQIGGVDDRMYAEQLHVPWLLKFPDRLGRLARSSQLVSHFDLLPTLIEATDASDHIGSWRGEGKSVRPLAHSSRHPWRDALVSASRSGHRAIRTAEWCLRLDATTDNEPRTDVSRSTSPRDELYVRPDDRWEANDVAKLCSEVVEALAGTMNDYLAPGLEPAAQARE
jgi:arylsulfatase A-like enzyme